MTSASTPLSLPTLFAPGTMNPTVTAAAAISSAASFLWKNTSSVLESTLTKQASTAVTRIPHSLPFTLVIIFLISGAFIVVLGVLGNAFVVGVIVTDRKLLNSSVNLFLLNLALADMGNLMFCAPDLIQAVLQSGWLLPSYLCPVIHFLQEYFLYASVLLQMSIGIERFLAICSPLRMQRFSRRTTVYFLVSAWGIAAMFAAPYGVKHKVVLYGKIYYCNWTSEMPLLSRYVIKYSEVFILYGIPLVLLTILYFVMCRRLWGKECMIANESQQMAILRLRRSVVKMLVISMLLYFICYTPIQSLVILDSFFNFQIQVTLPFRIVINMLPVSSSAANPIVYIMCCRHFHMRFVHLFAWCTRCLGSGSDKYQTVVMDAESKSCTTTHRLTMSRSPYVSFRKSTRTAGRNSNRNLTNSFMATHADKFSSSMATENGYEAFRLKQPSPGPTVTLL